ncbi:NADPH-dependent FMN reductase [Fructobacillus americanaquae]|uniref:NAD(P)H-dependent oxidoreductase n=1 Tax=Fructobacillus americanaquae TaxID=2940302 RepID=A0ABY5BYJ7_9LACO|nr:NADPH-dependent FMN reductase [Fructobacillus americanaquae]USS91581.1 NAD(P)H-dependent oxidoreductase [Fructobacillus americanaquae]
MKKIAVIVGSNRTKSVSRRLAYWLAPLLSGQEVQADVIDLATVALPFLDEPELPSAGHYQNQSTIDWSKQIQSYDGVVFVAPQYNWGYPAVLKNAIDTLYAEWRGLPVATVFFGGHGGFQADLAFSLVLQGVKVNRLPVNLRLNLAVGQVTEEMTAAELAELLLPYQSQVALMQQAFQDLWQHHE